MKSLKSQKDDNYLRKLERIKKIKSKQKERKLSIKPWDYKQEMKIETQ